MSDLQQAVDGRQCEFGASGDMRRDTRGSREVGVIARDHAPTPRAMRLPIRPWHPCRGWPDVSSGRKEGREMHGGLLWAAFEEWAAHHHSARRSVGLHRHAASEPHRLLLGPVPAAGRPARQRAWPTWPRLKHPEKIQTDTLILSGLIRGFFLSKGASRHGLAVGAYDGRSQQATYQALLW